MAKSLMETVYLGDVEGGRANNLNLIRFVAASLVVFSHSDIMGHTGFLDPMSRVFHFNANLGDIAVFAFFFISGYLILKSALRNPDPATFLRARVLRIFPGLATCILLLTFVVGPIFSTLPVHDYFRQWPTWRYLSTMILNHGAGLSLPGLFQDHANKEANVPVWTLSSEWFMYLMTLLAVLVFRRRNLKGPISTGSWAVLALAILVTAQMMPLPFHYSWKWFLSFLFGSAVYLQRRRIPLSIPIAIPVFLVDLALIRFVPHIGKAAFPASLFYLILVIGFHPSIYAAWFEHVGDLSYGLYIYTFPIQQIYGDHANSSIHVFLLSYLTVLPLAALSWRFIESPSLSLKSKVRRERAVEEGVKVAW